MFYNKTFSLKKYMAEIADYPLIEPAEEIVLGEAIARGEEWAREKLMVSNLRLVIKIAYDYRKCNIPLVDLIAEGNIGLVKAVDRFDPHRGAKFSSYASWWIKQRIRRLIANQSRMIRIPVQAVSKYRKIKEMTEQLGEELGREVVNKDVANAMGITENSLRKTVSTVNTSVSSLDLKVGEGEDSSFGDFIEDTSHDKPDEVLNNGQLIKILKEVVDEELSPREKEIIEMRYGLNEAPPQTLEQVSQVIGRTRERVRQIQHRALRKIRFRLQQENVEYGDCLTMLSS